MLVPAMADLASALRDLKVDEVVIENVCSVLEINTSDLEASQFADRAALAESAFGGSSEGQELGLHHDLAQKVVSDTIAGVIQDLITFRDGVLKAKDVIQDADLDTATEMRTTQEALDLMNTAYVHSQADAARAASRAANVTTEAVNQ